MKYTAFCCLSIIAGGLTGYAIGLIGSEVFEIQSPLLPILSSVVVSISIILASNNLSVREVKYLARQALGGN
jgi:hypothetical protein